MSSSTDRIVVGRVGRPHGLDGRLVVHPDTDHPGRFAPGSIVDVGGVTLSIASTRSADKGLLVRFEGVADRTAAEALQGSEITIADSERRALGKDEFWPDQLLGLEARTTAGARIGVIEAVVEGVAQYRLAISTGAGVREVPFVAELVPHVNLAGGYVEITDIDGLL